MVNMAQSTITDSQLQLILEEGMDQEGKPIWKNKNFNNVKVSATTDQLYAVTNVLVPLQQSPLIAIERNNTEAITSA